MRPKMGSFTWPSTTPSSTATSPPPQSTRRLAARAMSSSLSPTTSRLWASWATVWARAPWMPKPLAKPQAKEPVLWCRSKTKALRMSFSGEHSRQPSTTGTSRCSSFVMVDPALEVITRTSARSPVMGEPSACTAGIRNVSGLRSAATCMELNMKLGQG